MHIVPKIINAEEIRPFTISITFEDGLNRVINFEHVLGGWMSCLKDPKEEFSRFFISEGGTLEWPHGQDFNPEALYKWDEFEKHYIDDAKRNS